MNDDYQVFVNLVKDQFTYGGKKYAHSKGKEATDVLFDKYGKNWLFGTIDKYTFRFKTCKREKDLLKIACYQYITWLKRGFHIDNKRAVAIDTNVETKIGEFDNFIKRIDLPDEFTAKKSDIIHSLPGQMGEGFAFDERKLREMISERLRDCGNNKWEKIEEHTLQRIFKICYAIWVRNFKDKAGEDADTFNEDKKKNGK